MYLSKALKVSMILGLIFTSFLSCSRQSSRIEQADDVLILLDIEPKPASVGKSLINLQLSENSGPEIAGAKISARGDMTHAGMTPVFGEAQDLGLGHYQIPFEWTMAGSWIITIDVELPDGREIVRTFEIDVSAD